MKLVDLLNKYKGTVTFAKEPQVDFDPDESLLNEDGTVADPEFNDFLGRSDSFEVWFDVCPSERRLGTVPHVSDGEQTAWYCSNECTWISTE